MFQNPAVFHQPFKIFLTVSQKGLKVPLTPEACLTYVKEKLLADRKPKSKKSTMLAFLFNTYLTKKSHYI